MVAQCRACLQLPWGEAGWATAVFVSGINPPPYVPFYPYTLSYVHGPVSLTVMSCAQGQAVIHQPLDTSPVCISVSRKRADDQSVGPAQQPQLKHVL